MKYYNCMTKIIFEVEKKSWFGTKEEQHEVDVEFNYHKGCGATWGYSGGSPAEPSTVDVNFEPLEKLKGEPLTSEEEEIVSEELIAWYEER